MQITTSDQKAIVGIARYYRTYVQNMATMAQPLQNIIVEQHEQKTLAQKLKETIELARLCFTLISAIANLDGIVTPDAYNETEGHDVEGGAHRSQTAGRVKGGSEIQTERQINTERIRTLIINGIDGPKYVIWRAATETIEHGTSRRQITCRMEDTTSLRELRTTKRVT